MWQANVDATVPWCWWCWCVCAVSSVPMQNVAKPTRGRSMSMQDYDVPLRKRMNSTQMTCSPVIDASPSSVDGDGPSPPPPAAPGAGGGTAAAAAAAAAGPGEQLVANWLQQLQPWRHVRAASEMGWKCQRATCINQSTSIVISSFVRLCACLSVCLSASLPCCILLTCCVNEASFASVSFTHTL